MLVFEMLRQYFVAKTFTANCAGDARHSVSTLTEAQITDLTAYLDTL